MNRVRCFVWEVAREMISKRHSFWRWKPSFAESIVVECSDGRDKRGGFLLFAYKPAQLVAACLLEKLLRSMWDTYRNTVWIHLNCELCSMSLAWNERGERSRHSYLKIKGSCKEGRIVIHVQHSRYRHKLLIDYFFNPARIVRPRMNASSQTRCEWKDSYLSSKWSGSKALWEWLCEAIEHSAPCWLSCDHDR